VQRVYVTMGVIAELIICSLPEYDSQVEHADNLCSTLSMIGERSSIFGLVVPIGRPRQVNGSEPIW
jgi:hypothetical protein